MGLALRERSHFAFWKSKTRGMALIQVQSWGHTPCLAALRGCMKAVWTPGTKPIWRSGKYTHRVICCHSSQAWLSNGICFPQLPFLDCSSWQFDFRRERGLWGRGDRKYEFWILGPRILDLSFEDLGTDSQTLLGVRTTENIVFTFKI